MSSHRYSDSLLFLHFLLPEDSREHSPPYKLKVLAAVLTLRDNMCTFAEPQDTRLTAAWPFVVLFACVCVCNALSAGGYVVGEGLKPVTSA
jgi:hypothetical protein